MTALVVRMVGRLQVRLEALYQGEWPALEGVEIHCSESNGRYWVHCWPASGFEPPYMGGCESQEALLELFPLRVEVVEFFDQDV